MITKLQRQKVRLERDHEHDWYFDHEVHLHGIKFQLHALRSNGWEKLYVDADGLLRRKKSDPQ